MATKSSTAPTAVIVGKCIPSWDQWVVPKDPHDVSSKAMFTPWRLSLDKEGMFKCSHKGSADTIMTKRLEIVFLVALQATECRCTKKGDPTGGVVCESHDRVLSRTGFDCKTECPFAEKGVAQENKQWSRPLRKTALVLFREEGKDEPFKLGRYISSLNNVNALQALKDTLRQQLVASNAPDPYPSSHSAIISCTKESIGGGKTGTVGRLSSDVEIGQTLDKEAVEMISRLNEGILRWYSQKYADMSARNQKAREARLASQATMPQTIAAAQQAVITQATETMAQTQVYEVTPVSGGSEDNLGDAIIDPDDDSLDW